MEIQFNPFGSTMAIEGLTSTDGRIYGRMGHPERWQNGLFKNTFGQMDCRVFAGAVGYYK
jgi:phosphoribosylformylglycinamidine synthase